MTIRIAPSTDPLLKLLLGLEERGDRSGHDMANLVFRDENEATMGCRNCDVAVLAMIVNEHGAWRIDPDITSLDRKCETIGGTK